MQNYIEQFSRIEFDPEEHKYYLGGKTSVSVSTKIKDFYEPFDSSKYPVYLQNKWKEIGRVAAENGTDVHNFAEYYVFGCEKPKNEKELGVVQFFMDHSDYKVLGVEQRVYHFQFDYFGTADLLLEKDDKKILVDWKTNKTLYKDYGDYLYAPFEKKINNALNRYTLQLGLYELAMEQFIEIDERWIVHLAREEGKYYKVYKLPDITEKLKTYYDDRTRGNSDIKVDC